MTKLDSPDKRMPENGPNRKGLETFLPLLKIVWFSCLFFLVLFSFYAWTYFITATSPRSVPTLILVTFYFLGAFSYGLAEVMIQQRGPSHPKISKDFMQMISYSLFEAVGIYGLILAVLTQNFTQSLVFLLAAFIGLLRHQPVPSS